MRKKTKGSLSPRVFLGPVEVAGYYSNLAKGFRELGVQCTFFTFKPHPYGYGGEDPKPWLLVLEDKWDVLRRRYLAPEFLRKLFGVPSVLLRCIWIIYVILCHDVFIFGYGRSLTNRYQWDLWLIKLLGKKLIVNMAHGSEARPPYVCGTNQSPDGTFLVSTEDIVRKAQALKKRLRINERYADYIIGAPFSTTYFASRKLINWFSLGVPIQLPRIDGDQPKQSKGVVGQDSKPVRILHSPSHPALKGSRCILKAIENLKLKGFSIDLVLLTGRPHQEVLMEIRSCDFVVDQIYSDTPMAGFACEAAGYGKAVIVGGYGLQELRKHVPQEMWPPTYACLPEEVEMAIEKMIADPNARNRVGVESRRFLENRWQAVDVASRYLSLVSGDIPNSWWIEPRDVVYIAGGGQSLARTQELISEIIERFGLEGLHLTDRPDLEKSFLNLVGTNKSEWSDTCVVS